MRVCQVCSESKALDAYYKAQRGRHKTCKSCLKEQYRMLADLYRLADLNTKGEPLKQSGWRRNGGGLTPLASNPILDPDYEFEAPAYLTWQDLKDLL